MPRPLAFTRAMRLVHKNDFARAFRAGRRARGATAVVVVMTNGLDHSRLGLSVGRVIWSPTGEWLALSLAPGGGMNTQIYIVRPDGTGLRRLTDGGRETNNLGAWTHDGRRLTMGSNRATNT